MISGAAGSRRCPRPCGSDHSREIRCPTTVAWLDRRCLLLTLRLPSRVWHSRRRTPIGRRSRLRPSSADAAADETLRDDETDISFPGGGEIIVTGRRDRNVEPTADRRSFRSSRPRRSPARAKATSPARSAGSPASAWSATGFVYVRGLGDRYSLALLNGSPLPSPEPLRRVVPLDMFPTGVISSSLVQKSYSVNFPGEFGGGVINLTTKATPARGLPRPWAAACRGDTETDQPARLHLLRQQDRLDRLRQRQRATFRRHCRPFSTAATGSAKAHVDPERDRQAAGERPQRGRPALEQDCRPTSRAPIFRPGKILGHRRRRARPDRRRRLQQQVPARDAAPADLARQRSVDSSNTDFDKVTPRISGSSSTGCSASPYEFGDNTHPLDQSLRPRHHQAVAARARATATAPTPTSSSSTPAWYERQLIDTQLVGEFKLTPEVSASTCAAATPTRGARRPYELSFEYVRTNNAGGPLRRLFRQPPEQRQQRRCAKSASPMLDEDLWSGGASRSRLDDRRTGSGYGGLRLFRHPPHQLAPRFPVPAPPTRAIPARASACCGPTCCWPPT